MQIENVPGIICGGELDMVGIIVHPKEHEVSSNRAMEFVFDELSVPSRFYTKDAVRGRTLVPLGA